MTEKRTICQFQKAIHEIIADYLEENLEETTIPELKAVKGGTLAQIIGVLHLELDFMTKFTNETSKKYGEMKDKIK